MTASIEEVVSRLRAVIEGMDEAVQVALRAQLDAKEACVAFVEAAVGTRHPTIRRAISDSRTAGEKAGKTAQLLAEAAKAFAGIRNGNAVIKFVAEMRTDIEGGGSEIDAATAEAVITSVLDSSATFTATLEMLGKIQTLATYKALTEENLTDDELDELLSQAVQLADSQG